MYQTSPKSLVLTGAFSIATLLSVSSNATIVEFETSQGNFKINLHDQTTPKTVENFLRYINDGDFNNTVVHRLVPNFIMQAGGFEFNGNFPLTAIDVDSSVKNEPLYSNVRATVAMAKVANSPNSATSQWFINYKDNSAILDRQNGGFTVFGEVIEGMDNIDKIAQLPICQSIPMPDYTDEQCANSNFVPADENFVTIRTVTISNSSTTTSESLSPVKNTLINQESSSSDSSGGGSLSYFALLALSLVGLRRKMKIS